MRRIVEVGVGAIIVALTAGLGFQTSPAAAGGDDMSPAALGCNHTIGWWDLKSPSGKKRPGIGELAVSDRHEPGRNRFCVITRSGSVTRGHDKRMTIRICFRDTDDGSTWCPTGRQYRDAGGYSDYAGAVYGEIPAGYECLIAKGSIRWKGKTFKRKAAVACYH